MMMEYSRCTLTPIEHVYDFDFQHFGHGLVSVNLSDVSLISLDKSTLSSGDHFECSFSENDLSSILHDSPNMNAILKENLSVHEQSSLVTTQDQDANGNSGCTPSKLHTALRQLDAVCDWLHNEPTYYQAKDAVPKNLHINHNILAKCSMSSLPRNMCDSLSFIHESKTANIQQGKNACVNITLSKENKPHKQIRFLKLHLIRKLHKISKLFKRKNNL